MNQPLDQRVAAVLKKIRSTAPLIYNVTNFVVMEHTANVLLSLGASPIMSLAKKEAVDIASKSAALVVNMGTLSTDWVKCACKAIAEIKKNNRPFVFDPVGIGVSGFRNKTAATIVQSGKPEVVRGNATEISKLVGSEIITAKGVDNQIVTTETLMQVVKQTIAISHRYKNTIVISGATDYVITGNRIIKIFNGDSLMQQITGMGCAATAIIAACLSVEKDVHLACMSAMVLNGIAGELAGEKIHATGSFRNAYYDYLSTMNEETIISHMKYEIPHES